MPQAHAPRRRESWSTVDSWSVASMLLAGHSVRLQVTRSFHGVVFVTGPLYGGTVESRVSSFPNPRSLTCSPSQAVDYARKRLPRELGKQRASGQPIADQDTPAVTGSEHEAEGPGSQSSAADMAGLVSLPPHCPHLPLPSPPLRSCHHVSLATLVSPSLLPSYSRLATLV